MTDIVERLHGTILDAAIRLTNSAFDKRGDKIRRAQFSIPADPERDSDLLVSRGISEAAEEIRRLRVENQRLAKSRDKWGQKYNTMLEKLKIAVWSDSEECKLLTEDNASLRTALAASEAKVATARNDALEEAAKYLETQFALGVGDYAAVKIRALKEITEP